MIGGVYILSLYGYGNDYGDGDGDGNGNGYGYGNGDGYGGNGGDGNGNGYGNGGGYGDGDGIYKIKMWGEWFECSGEIENSLCHNLPVHLYDKIDKGFISKVNNLESLRSLREKIGLERYIELLDAKVICEQVDNQGFPMKLYQYKEQDEKVILLEVVCPSTDRVYHLYPPNQKAKDCWEAKKSTFRNQPIKYRHGDAALVEIGKAFNAPIHES
jgi:hypothetical protein